MTTQSVKFWRSLEVILTWKAIANPWEGVGLFAIRVDGKLTVTECRSKQHLAHASFGVRPPGAQRFQPKTKQAKPIKTRPDR